MKKLYVFNLFLFITYQAISQSPTITSFSPTSGPIGTLITVKGLNLDSATILTIGGISAIIVSDNTDSVVGMIMPGTATGAVSVTTNGGRITSSSNYTVTRSHYPNTQQGSKLVGTGISIGPPIQGSSVAISADGNTAIVGGFYDNGSEGAAWIYTRQGNVWTQQGNKLAGTGYQGSSQQGFAVSISADGNTALVGGDVDNGGKGALWVYTRTGNTWAQQGAKLVGTGMVGNGNLGVSVALSADGNTAIAGAPYDNSDTGATWVFTRTGGIWTQSGTKLVSTDVTNNGSQGQSVAISADGQTAIVGAFFDNSASVFIRSGNSWTQQGPKLRGTGGIGISSQQGLSVAISGDGNTAMVGGPTDNSDTGAVWVFTRSGTIWSQQGSKLVGTGTGSSYQGIAVSLSADGNTAIVGGSEDNNNTGSIWIFTRSGTNWIQRGGKLVGTGAVGNALQGQSASLSADGSTAVVGGEGDDNMTGAAWIFSNVCSPQSSSIIYGICSGDTFVFGSRRLTTQGTYSDTFTTIGDCDSIVILHLTVHSLPAVSFIWDSLRQAGDVLSNINSTVADWRLLCNPNIFAMKGGYPTGGFYSGRFIQNDTASITLSQSDWSGLVDTITYTFTDSNGCKNKVSDSLILHGPCEGIPNVSETEMQLYPNPNRGSFTLKTYGIFNKEYQITNIIGNVILQGIIRSDTEIIKLPDGAEGVYILTVNGLPPFRFVSMQ